MNLQLSIAPFVAPLEVIPKLAKKETASAPFQKVSDPRGNAIRGLWQRNGRFYAQMRIPGKRNASKVPLVDPTGAPLRTVAQARATLNDLLSKRRANSLPYLNRTPTLGESIESYLGWVQRSRTKSPLTIAKEAGALAKWNERVGFVRLGHLRRGHINEFIAWRKEMDQVSNRTINLDIIALNNCLRHARDEGVELKMPTENWRPLEHVSSRRPLWTQEQIERVCQKAREEHVATGQLLADYLKFLAHSGARRNEALNVEWGHIDWERGIVEINKTKFGRRRHVDINPRLEEHLKDMLVRKSASKWLFPSPRWTAQNDGSASNLPALLGPVRDAAGLPDFCFHDLRHYFISNCVMAGVDYLTIARWVGHRDGGILIGRIYGHLNDAHAKRMAARLAAL